MQTQFQKDYVEEAADDMRLTVHYTVYIFKILKI